MRTSFYTGASGLVAFQEDMNVIGNNIANCSTTGYKAQETSFSQLLSSEMDINSEDRPLVGNGVRAVNKGIDPSEAAVVASSGSLDLAISGDGWFCIENNGQKEYSRDGSFGISLSGYTAYLVNQNGAYVLDSHGNKIYETVDLDKGPIDTDSMLNEVGIYKFANPEALTPVSSNSYLANDYTGSAKAADEDEYTLLKGYLEQSGVSLADEMVALITAQRGYQISARVVQTADEVEQTVNSLRA